jgi:nitrite reductase/ring-hydroxylating ferredoxin subunit/uncharacterized membrane protein
LNLHRTTEKLGTIEELDQIAEPLAGAVKNAVKQGTAKDVLSGTWLGHQLHPLLTDVPIGAFTSATILDLVGGEDTEKAAAVLVGVGLLAAVPTAASGAADWSDTYGPEQRIGVVHALSNVAGLVLYGASLAAHTTGRRGLGKLLGLAGMGVLTIGGYLGGYLSYSRGVGVNNAFFEHGPEDWKTVASESELSDGKPARVEVDGASVLLYKLNGRIFAIGARCSHAGGPLEEGQFDTNACTVECPWHQSVFSLTDGEVVHGPATTPQAAYEVRVVEGHVEVRRAVLTPA